MIKQNLLKIKTQFSDELITSKSGMILFAESLKGFGVDRELLNLPKPGSNRGIEASKYLLAILLNFAAGGCELEDVIRLCEDKVLKKALGLSKFTSETLSKWLRRNSCLIYSKIKNILNKLTTKIIKRSGLKELTYDVDAMVIEAHKQTALMTYKGFKGYMPLLGFIPELKLNIFEKFQTGNTSPSSGILASLKASELILPKGVRFKNLRSDSAGWNSELINYCEENGIEYTITAELNIAVKRAIQNIAEKAWKTLLDEKGNETDREYAETIYSMEKNKNAHRLIVQRAKNQQLELFSEGKQRHYVISTNKPEEISTPEIINWHNGRGNSENFNKEIKYGVNLDYLPTNDFNSNKLWFTLGVLTYNLIQALKLFVLPESWQTKKIASIRFQLFDIAGKLVYHAKQVILNLASISKETYQIFIEARRKLYQLYKIYVT